MPAPGRMTGERRPGLPGYARYAGLAGSALLALAATRIGARPGAADLDGLPAAADLPWLLAAVAGLAVLALAWWRVDRLPALPPTRWLLVTAALWAVPLLATTPLASRDVYAYACQGASAAAGLDPTTTGPAVLPCPWLDSVPPIWRDAPSPYGPLAGLVSHAATALAGDRLAVAVGVLRVAALLGVVLGVVFGGRLARACGVPVGRAAWLGLATPLVLLHVVSGAHHDALLTGLIVAALGVAVASPRAPARRPGGALLPGVLAGVLLGAAAAVKVTAVLALPFAVLALLAASRPASVGRLAGAAGTVTAGAAGAFAALSVAAGSGFGFLSALGRTGDLTQWTSPPSAVGMTIGYALRALGLPGGGVALAVVRLLALVALAAFVATVWWRAWRAPAGSARCAAVRGAGLAFAALALLGPVFYPWYALPALALLAVSTVDARGRTWLAGAATALAFLVLPNGAGLAARTKLPGAVLVTVALGVAAWRLVRNRGLARGA
ncbi:polyprenol phosphomannose-dependent alpha 1,6 mannosyltransferase MptB [Luedemannella helvata]|uniref:Alpha-1,6-mannosyltransferase n=1 Tax=Luedemannella helvata TaxID=349315 RepID=A0ABN2JZ65_9ACTN